MTTIATVSEYLAATSPKARKALRQIRTAILKAAPGITERISYRIPTFDLDGKYLLYMAAFKDHVGVYPATASMMAMYGPQLQRYRSGAGTLRFELDERLPLALITKLAELRVQERRAATAKPRSTHPNAAAFPPGLSGPALRALAEAGITSMAQLARWRAEDVAALHGTGPKVMRLLQQGLAAQGRHFKRASGRARR